MIKILKIGENAFKLISCSNCNSELEFTMSDCEVTTVGNRYTDEELLKNYALRCPVCGNEIPINSVDKANNIGGLKCTSIHLH